MTPIETLQFAVDPDVLAVTDIGQAVEHGVVDVVIFNAVSGKGFDFLTIDMDLQSLAIVFCFSVILLLNSVLVEVLHVFLASQHWPDRVEQSDVVIK